MDAIFPDTPWEGVEQMIEAWKSSAGRTFPMESETTNMSIEKRALIPRVGVASLCSPLEVGADRAPQAAVDLAQILAGRRLRGR